MKNAVLVFLLFIALLPVSASAALNAGVVSGVWFSKSTPEAGEEIRIFTAVQNTSGQTVSGTITFLVDEKIVGSTKFTVNNNSVIPVSVPYTFEDGPHDVSAYISSSENDVVSYTIVADTPVSVVRKTNAQEAVQQAASSTIEAVKQQVAKTKDEVEAKVNPIAESTAKKIEEFRNTLLQPPENEDDAQAAEPVVRASAAPTTKKEAAQRFVDDSKTIASSIEVPLWKKGAAIGLSALALLARFWFVLIILAVGLFFWKMVRGQRIV